MHLFTNNYVPDSATTLANLYSNEAAYDNYSPQSLSAVSWSVGLDAANQGFASANQVVEFSNSTGATPQTINGYWIDNSTTALTGGTALYSVDVITPLSMSVAGSSIQIQPQLNGVVGSAENASQIIG
jgi:hypothetical protein